MTEFAQLTISLKMSIGDETAEFSLTILQFIRSRTLQKDIHIAYTVYLATTYLKFPKPLHLLNPTHFLASQLQKTPANYNPPSKKPKYPPRLRRKSTPRKTAGD